MSTEETTPRRGVIENIGFADLRYAKTAEDLAGITQIRNVGLVLFNEEVGGPFSAIPIENVGGIVPVPGTVKVNIITGQVQLTGASLESGDPDTILLIAGQTFISGTVKSVGYKEIRIFGQFFAPRDSEDVISAKVTQLSGQNFFLPANPRFFMGDETISTEFLELLPGAEPFVVMGQIIFEADVAKELVQQKVPEIVLMGKIEAPRHLIPLLQVLTKSKMGEIVVAP